MEYLQKNMIEEISHKLKMDFFKANWTFLMKFQTFMSLTYNKKMYLKGLQIINTDFNSILCLDKNHKYLKFSTQNIFENIFL